MSDTFCNSCGKYTGWDIDRTEGVAVCRICGFEQEIDVEEIVHQAASSPAKPGCRHYDVTSWRRTKDAAYCRECGKWMGRIARQRKQDASMF